MVVIKQGHQLAPRASLHRGGFRREGRRAPKAVYMTVNNPEKTSVICIKECGVTMEAGPPAVTDTV